MDSEIWRGLFGIVVLLAIACRIFWDDSSQEFEQYTLPVRRPQQHWPVYQLPPHRLPPSQSYRSSPHRPPSPPKYEDDNRKDQQNEYYIGLRARANKEGDEMARCFSKRREAYSRRDRAAAKDLTSRGENHKQKMEQLNKEASNWIYLENNRDRKPGEIDLHGLYVKEAIAYTDAALKEAKLRGDSEIRLIVGKGSHSEGGEAKVRPAIEDLMRKYRLVAEFDSSNSGVLVVELNGLTPIRHRNISHRHSSGRHGGRRAINIGA
ncbi:Smr-domain-containing protein [Armillaria gallica]|uniref:Smr-domain-containing protein n=1 Tax=Armillaria gallica TaxID=47427 RepID=A0A2H3CXI2_ARMGA|nr:Smr-domain-containing protein [Armillaria gallica]